MAVCRCVCGNIVERHPTSIRDCVRSSCGCKSKIPEETNMKHGNTRGKKASTEYASWRSMIDRCHNPRSKYLKNYGGRGIKVCERWRGENGFENFLFDLGKKPTQQHTIDRIDVNGNYEPENCKWATKKEQARNRRNTVWLEVAGNRMCAADLHKATGLSSYWISELVKSGVSGDDIVKKSIEGLLSLLKNV